MVFCENLTPDKKSADFLGRIKIPSYSIIIMLFLDMSSRTARSSPIQLIIMITVFKLI